MFSATWFVNFYNIVSYLLPSFLYTPSIRTFVESCTVQVRWLYQSVFYVFVNKTVYDLGFNGQVFSMENRLNDRFDNVNRTIYITDGFTKQRYYIYSRAEAKSKFLPEFIHNRADYADTGCDFIVWVPYAVTISLTDMYELRALVNKYKLDPKRYRIYRV